MYVLLIIRQHKIILITNESNDNVIYWTLKYRPKTSLNICITNTTQLYKHSYDNYELLQT